MQYPNLEEYTSIIFPNPALFLQACSTKKCDNLLVQTDIFSILGVSFCVMQNAFNFIERKSKNIGHSSENIILPYVVLFKLMEFLFPFASHNFFLIATALL